MLMRKSSSFCVVLFSSVLLYGLYRRLCDSGAATPWILGGRAPKALGTRGSGLEDLRSVVTEREGIASLLFNFWLRTCSGKLSLCAQNFIRGPTTPLQCRINANRGPWQLFALTSGGRSPPEAKSILVNGCPTEPANLAPIQKCPFEIRYTHQSLTENSMLSYGPLVSELGAQSAWCPQPRHWGACAPTGSAAYDYQHNTTITSISVQFSSSLSQLQWHDTV